MYVEEGRESGDRARDCQVQAETLIRVIGSI